MRFNSGKFNSGSFEISNMPETPRENSTFRETCIRKSSNLEKYDEDVIIFFRKLPGLAGNDLPSLPESNEDLFRRDQYERQNLIDIRHYLPCPVLLLRRISGPGYTALFPCLARPDERQAPCWQPGARHRLRLSLWHRPDARVVNWVRRCVLYT